MDKVEVPEWWKTAFDEDGQSFPGSPLWESLYLGSQEGNMDAIRVMKEWVYETECCVPYVLSRHLELAVSIRPDCQNSVNRLTQVEDGAELLNSQRYVQCNVFRIGCYVKSRKSGLQEPTATDLKQDLWFRLFDQSMRTMPHDTVSLTSDSKIHPRPLSRNKDGKWQRPGLSLYSKLPECIVFNEVQKDSTLAQRLSSREGYVSFKNEHKEDMGGVRALYLLRDDIALSSSYSLENDYGNHVALSVCDSNGVIAEETMNDSYCSIPNLSDYFKFWGWLIQTKARADIPSWMCTNGRDGVVAQAFNIMDIEGTSDVSLKLREYFKRLHKQSHSLTGSLLTPSSEDMMSLISEVRSLLISIDPLVEYFEDQLLIGEALEHLKLLQQKKLMPECADGSK